ncbi:MAG: hypothetical protein NXI00_01560 [Cytophagales bacterium]|nr:hypothetical protein [Cytophagales bacterium]
MTIDINVKPYLFALILLQLSCQNTSDYNEDFDTIIENESLYEDEDLSESDYHTNSNFKYEYRTGESGNYNYNYDVDGYDGEGGYVHGNIDMQGKYGDGYIYDDEGNEKHLDLEWSGYGTLEGYDEDGEYYELEID